jgi:hypothetical protein
VPVERSVRRTRLRWVLLVAAAALGVASAVSGNWLTAGAMVLLITGQLLGMRHERRADARARDGRVG